jgi:hypothetical protein
MGSSLEASNTSENPHPHRGLIMARHSNPPSREGGYEFEAVELGPPTYFAPKPMVKARGQLIPLGEAEGLEPRPAPIVRARRDHKSKLKFTVLLRDKCTVTVFGHAAKYLPISGGVYKILARVGGRRTVVAVFPATEVIGVFSGDFESNGATVEVTPKTTGEPE